MIGRLKATVVAGVAVVLLGGLAALAVSVVGGLAVLTVWYTANNIAQYGLPSGNALRFAALTWAVTTALVGALWVVLHDRDRAGVRVVAGPEPRPPTRGRDKAPVMVVAPQLWATVRDVAAQVGIRPPDEIWLIAESEVMVAEFVRLFGVVRGRRVLYLGAPLLVTFTMAELMAVIAHEFGHYARGDTWFTAVISVGRRVVERATDRMDARSSRHVGMGVVRMVFRGYFWPFMRVSRAIDRRTELQADRVAARVAGAVTTVDALRALPTVGHAWTCYMVDCVEFHRAMPRVPDDITGHFGDFLAFHATCLAERFGPPPMPTPSVWDSHPPLADRVAALAALTITHPVPDAVAAQAGLPADLLVPDLARVDTHILGVEKPTAATVPFWDHVMGVAVERSRRDTEQLYRAAAVLSGVHQAGLGTVLDSIAAGHAPRLAAVVAASRIEPHGDTNPRRILADRLTSALTVAAEHCPATAGWRYNWSRDPVPVDTAGAPIDLATLATEALQDTPGALVQVRSRLAGLGLDETADAPAAATAGPGPAELALGALANVLVNGRRYDLLRGRRLYDLVIYPGGLLFLPGNKWDSTTERITSVVRELDESQRPPVGGWYLSFADVAAATLLHRRRANTRFTLVDGTTVTMTETYGAGSLGLGAGRIGNSREQLRAIVDAIELARATTDPPTTPRQRGRPSRGTTFLTVGALVLATSVALATGNLTSADPVEWLWWSSGAIGLLLIGLGIARRSQRWPRRAGNGWKISGAIWVLLTLGGTVNRVHDGRSVTIDVVHLAFAAALVAIGVVLARRRPRKRQHDCPP
jgi:Zn-dependent protease with chaperone function